LRKQTLDCTSLHQRLTDLTREEDLLLLKKETSQTLSNPSQRKKFFQEEQSKLQAQLAGIMKDRDDAFK